MENLTLKQEIIKFAFYALAEKISIKFDNKRINFSLG